MNNFLMMVVAAIGITVIIKTLKSLGIVGEKILRVIVFLIFLVIVILMMKVLVPDVLTELRKIK